MKQKKSRVNFITFANPANAYSGIQYICEELTKRGIQVQLFCRIPSGMAHATKAWPFSIYNVADKWYGNIPVLRTALYFAKILLLFLTGERNFIFHEAHFFRFNVLFKKLSNRTRCVHYATELYEVSDEPAHKTILEYYARHANVPDLVVECEENRARYRRTRYSITAPICVVPNTLPRATVGGVSTSSLDEAVFAANTLDSPILIYSGAGYLHRELDKIIDGVAMATTKVFLVLACYGPRPELEKLRSYATEKLGDQGFAFFENLTRSDIYVLLRIAHGGIVYYRPSLSIGNRYAAPTKFYEYVAAGVPVVSSHNASLTTLIDRYQLGSYTEDESPGAIAGAIDRVFCYGKTDEEKRQRIRRAFETDICFEVAARDGMDQIENTFRRSK